MKPEDTKEWGILSIVLAVMLLALMAVLAGGAALRESVTVDEVSHIGAGVSYLQRLDLRMNFEHPPLPKVLAAIPRDEVARRCERAKVSWAPVGQPGDLFTDEHLLASGARELTSECVSQLAKSRNAQRE